MLLETLLALRQAGQELLGPSCLALRDLSSSPPWCRHAPVLGKHAGRRGCAGGLFPSGAASPACGSAFRAALVESAASQSAAGRRRRQVLLLLFLLLLLVLLLLRREPLSHQTHFPQAHQEVSVLALLWWAGAEVAKN